MQNINFTIITEELSKKIEQDLDELKAMIQDISEKNGKAWLSRKEFMNQCSIGTTKFYELLREGWLETRKIGRKMYVHRDSVGKYFDRDLKKQNPDQ